MQVEKVYHRPLIPLTVALMAGIALGAEAPGLEGWALGLAGVCAVALGRCLWCRSSAGLSPVILFIAVGYLSLQPWVDPRFSAEHVSRYLDSGPWDITGIVDGRPLEFESRARFVLQVERLQSEKESRPVSGRLRVTVTGPVPDIEQGDRILVHSRIRSLRNFNNPGGFDYRRHMGFQEIWGSVFAEGPRLVVLDRQAEIGFFRWIDDARAAIARLIDRAGLGPEATVLKALVMGDQSGIPAEIRQAFTRTGTSHILAISGLHITIVASVAFTLFRWTLSWVPFFLQRAWVRKGAALLTLAPVTLYALIAGFSPSTQRALIMVAVFLLAFLVERETDLMNTLALAALGILAVMPQSLFSVSFQLSFVAVLSIVYGMDCFRAPAPREASLPAGKSARVRRGLLLFFGVSLLATWGTLPLCLYYFNLVSIIGLLANCAAIPLIGYLAVALGLAGALIAPLSAAAALVFFRLGGWVLSPSIALMDWLAGLPFAAVRTVTPSRIEIALFFVISWAGLELVARRRRAGRVGPAAFGAGSARGEGQSMAGSPPGGFWSKASLSAVFREKAALIALLAGLVAGAVDAGYWIYQRFGRQDLRLTLIDVGQGNAALLEFPGGATALVDGGGFADPLAFDLGAHVVGPFLWRNKIATLDTLILTHPNSDHLNGLIFLADNFNVAALWSNGEARDIPGYGLLMRTAAARGIARPAFAQLPPDSTLGGARLQVLYPPADFLQRRETERWRQDENNNSLVTRVSLGAVSILLPGDIMRPAEKELVTLAGEQLKSTLLVAPHHGSRTSSSEEFLKAVAPQLVLISCADRPGSGLPHPQTLQRYAALGASVYRTDRDGAIQLTTDGRSFSIRTHPGRRGSRL